MQWIKASAAAAVGEPSWASPDVRAHVVFNAVARLSVCAVRTLVELRRLGKTAFPADALVSTEAESLTCVTARQGSVVFASVVAPLISVVDGLHDMAQAFVKFRIYIEWCCHQTQPPYDLDIWRWCIDFIERKLIGYKLFTWDVASMLVDSCKPGQGPDSCAQYRVLVHEIELRAARALKGLLTETVTHTMLIPDYFARPSFMGGYFGSLAPGTRTVELGVRAVKEAREGGRLQGVGLTIEHLQL